MSDVFSEEDHHAISNLKPKDTQNNNIINNASAPDSINSINRYI